MIDAVGSNARCGSDVLMVNELSTTSVGAATERVVAPNAASAHTRAVIVVSVSSKTRLTMGLLFLRGIRPMTLFDGGRAGEVVAPDARWLRRRTFGLQPARRGPSILQRHERRLVDLTTVKHVWAARM